MLSPAVHATCLSLDGAGVLLRGPSGCGKSDLALRLIDAGRARLVGDDYCDFRVDGDALVVRPLPAGAGLLEVRGLGILRLDSSMLAPQVSVVAIIDLTPGRTPERLPEPSWDVCHGIRLRRFWLDPFEVSAEAKVRLAARLASGTMETLS